MSGLSPWLREILRCPVCRGVLEDMTGAGGEPALQCAGQCSPEGEARVFPIRDGIPVLLADESRFERA